jgi:hypothetical protein
MRPLGLSVSLEIWNTPRTTDRIYMKLHVMSRSFTKLCEHMSIIVKKGKNGRVVCLSSSWSVELLDLTDVAE